jgi:uncharacterized membrane protein
VGVTVAVLLLAFGEVPYRAVLLLAMIATGFWFIGLFLSDLGASRTRYRIASLTLSALVIPTQIHDLRSSLHSSVPDLTALGGLVALLLCMLLVGTVVATGVWNKMLPRYMCDRPLSSHQATEAVLRLRTALSHSDDPLEVGEIDLILMRFEEMGLLSMGMTGEALSYQETVAGSLFRELFN